MKNLKHNSNYSTKDFKLTNEKLDNALADTITNNWYTKSAQELDTIDVDINHLEKIFTDQTYYLAMKIVPLLEKKVLYLLYVENLRLNDICRRLKLQKRQAISLRNKGITHFKNNLTTLDKANILKKGGK